MKENDTIRLLKECDAGSKMAVASFDEVISRIKDEKMRQLLRESKQFHTELGNEIHSALIGHGSEEKDPNPVAKGMSWMKTNLSMAMDDSDQEIAELMTDGCNMGVKSLNRYMNQYEEAGDDSKRICKKLISEEKELAEGLQRYL